MVSCPKARWRGRIDTPDWLGSVLPAMAGPSFRSRPAALPFLGTLLALMLEPAIGAAPASATTTAADLSAAVTAATAELRQGWAADPTTAALPFPSVRLLPRDASVQGTCNPKASARVPAPTAAYCASRGEVLLDRDLLADAYGQAKPPQGRALVTYWIATALAERLLPAAPDGAGSDVLRILQATCRGGVLLGASPARQAFPDATPLLMAARSAYGDRYAAAVGSASQRGYALLTGLGATGTPSCDAAEMGALVKGAVPDPALLATIEQLPPPERAYGSLLGAINSQCKPLLPKRPCPRKQ
ncbi:MAG: hypothetical protein RLZZ216_381 [Cyanobacteriota bacterium]